MLKKAEVPSKLPSSDITERNQVEKALQDSEELFRALIENSSDIVQIVDSEGVIRYVSPSVQRVLGYKPEELIGRLSVDVVHPDDLPIVVEGFEKAIQEPDVPVITECRCKHKDGTWRVIRGIGVNRLAAPFLKGFVSNMHDITERKRMEHDLREHAKKLQCLYDIAYIVERPVITLDELCQEVVNLLPAGWQYPEITCARITLGDKEFMTDNFKITEWKQSTNIKIKGQKEGSVEVYYLEERPEVDEGSFLKDERLLIGVVAERLGRITERKRMEEEMRVKDNAIASSINAVAIADLEGNLTYVNHAFLRMWGYDGEKEVLGKSAVEFWQVAEEAVKVMQVAMDRGGWIGELSARRKDGSKFDAQLSASVVRDEAGEPICRFGSFIDITERKRMEEEMRSFNKLAVDRELRMIELKKEINIILQKLGEEPRYKIVEENKTKLNK